MYQAFLNSRQDSHLTGRVRIRDRQIRRGAVLPLMAIVLPVLLILAGFAVNVSYMQLTKTELKIATDAAARGAGRAFSEYQKVDQALTHAQNVAGLNTVAGHPLTLDTTDNTGDVHFGASTRDSSGFGRYSFIQRDTKAVRDLSQTASAIRVTGRRTNTSPNGPISLVFRGFGPLRNFEPTTSSVVTQVDRDIALILDRSGSMLEAAYKWQNYYKDVKVTETYVEKGKTKTRTVTVRQWTPPEMEQRYNAYTAQLAQYNSKQGGPMPDDSRWASLVAAVDAFLTVLEGTDQEEQVSVATFASTAKLDLNLVKTYGSIRTLLKGTKPTGNTSIGAGMNTGLPTLIGSFSRPYAAKTILVLTDGINNTNPTPQTAATTIVNKNNVTIHTVSFSDDADKNAMKQVANIGGGKHYHANEKEELIAIFREIANNLPTITTE